MAAAVPPPDSQAAAAAAQPAPQPPPRARDKQPRSKEDVMRFGCVATVKTFDKTDKEIGKVSKAWHSVRDAYRAWRKKPVAARPTKEEVTYQSPWQSGASRSVTVRPGDYESIKTRFLLNEGIYSDENSRYIIDSTAGRVFLETEENGVKKYESFSIINPETGEPMQKTEKLIRAAKLIIATKKDEKAGNCFDEGDLVVFHVDIVNNQENLSIRLFDYQAWKEGDDRSLQEQINAIDKWSERRKDAYEEAYQAALNQADNRDDPQVYLEQAERAGRDARKKVNEAQEKEFMIHKVRKWDPKAPLFGKDGSVVINPADRLYGREVKFKDDLKGELARVLRLKDDGKLRDDKSSGGGGGGGPGGGGGGPGGAGPASAAAQQLAQRLQQMQQAGAQAGAGAQPGQDDLQAEMDKLARMVAKQEEAIRAGEEREQQMLQHFQQRERQGDARIRELEQRIADLAQKGQQAGQAPQADVMALEQQLAAEQRRAADLQLELQELKEAQRRNEIRAMKEVEGLQAQFKDLQASIAAAHGRGQPMAAEEAAEAAAAVQRPQENIPLPEGFAIFSIPPDTKAESVCAVYSASMMLAREAQDATGIDASNEAAFRDRMSGIKQGTLQPRINEKAKEWFDIEPDGKFAWTKNPQKKQDLQFYLKTIYTSAGVQSQRCTAYINFCDKTIASLTELQAKGPLSKEDQHTLDELTRGRDTAMTQRSAAARIRKALELNGRELLNFARNERSDISPMSVKSLTEGLLTEYAEQIALPATVPNTAIPLGFPDDPIVRSILLERLTDTTGREVQIYDTTNPNPLKDFDAKNEQRISLLYNGDQYFLLRKVASSQG